MTPQETLTTLVFQAALSGDPVRIIWRESGSKVMQCEIMANERVIFAHRRAFIDSMLDEKPVVEKFHRDAREVLQHLNIKADRSFRETDFNLTTISARLREPGVEIGGVQIMIDRMCAKWKSDPKMADYLRPETLFGKQKFDSYYAARELPVCSNGAASAFAREAVSMPETRRI